MAKVVLTLGDDVSTDVIYPGRFMATVLPGETPRHAFADNESFHTKLTGGNVAPGSIIVAGWNFGCGSSREQAASALKGYELAVVAKGFAGIFLRNAVNLGLKTVICPGLNAKDGDELAVEEGSLRNLTTGVSFEIVALPRARQAILDAGGLIPYARRRLPELEQLENELWVGRAISC